MNSWQQVARDFAINENMAWLNNCGVSPPPRRVQQVMADYLQSFSSQCIFSSQFTFDGVASSIKNTLASLLNADRAEMALIHNTAEGMNFIAHGLDFKAGDEVIVLANEYPSNVYAWRNLGNPTLIVKEVSLGDSATEFMANLEASLSEKTRLVSLSAVHWLTGQVIPLEQAGQLCESRNILFAVDGAQGVGHIPIDVKKMKIDFMAFSAWKWLMGPLGMGAMYIRQEKLSRLKPVFMSTGSVVNDEEYLPYRDELKPSADRYTYSTPDFTAWVYFMASLAYLEEIGFQKVQQRIYKLADVLRQGLKKAKFRTISTTGWQASGIVVAGAGDKAAEIVDYLAENKVAASLRAGRIRFSPHILNTEEQLEKVIQLSSNYPGQ